MPRIALVVAALAGGCFFEATYRRDAAVVDDDAPADGAGSDARVAAMTCVDPGLLTGTATGTTASRSNLVTASCEGSVMNGPDAVYRIDAQVGAQLLVSISGSYAVNAYVLAPCSAAPATPTCLTNMAAAVGDPISVTTTFAGQHFIVVDNPNPALSGTYTLTVTVQ